MYYYLIAKAQNGGYVFSAYMCMYVLVRSFNPLYLLNQQAYFCKLVVVKFVLLVRVLLFIAYMLIQFMLLGFCSVSDI